MRAEILCWRIYSAMFGTEGSSQCIIALLFLSMVYKRKWEALGLFPGGNES